MSRTPYLVVPEASMILMKNEKVFLLRRCNTSYMDGYYCFPAGHKEKGETPMTAAIREAKEEAGIDIDPAHVTCVHTMYRMNEKDERPAYFFLALHWTGEPANVEPEKADDGQWFSLTALPDNMVPYMHDALDAYRRGDMYSETDH